MLGINSFVPLTARGLACFRLDISARRYWCFQLTIQTDTVVLSLRPLLNSSLACCNTTASLSDVGLVKRQHTNHTGNGAAWRFLSWAFFLVATCRISADNLLSVFHTVVRPLLFVSRLYFRHAFRFLWHSSCRSLAERDASCQPRTNLSWSARQRSQIASRVQSEREAVHDPGVKTDQERSLENNVFEKKNYFRLVLHSRKATPNQTNQTPMLCPANLH